LTGLVVETAKGCKMNITYLMRFTNNNEWRNEIIYLIRASY